MEFSVPASAQNTRPPAFGNRWAALKIMSTMMVAIVATHAAAASGPAGAAALRTTYTTLTAQLANNPFKRPVVMNSTESASTLKGDIYAVVDHPIGQLSTALSSPARWCDVLMLHLNTKYCHVNTNADGTLIEVRIGKKYDQPIEDAYRVGFVFHTGTTNPEYFDTELDAAEGPMGTSNYRIMLEAVAIPGKKSFLHLTYSYEYGFVSKIAMKGYLATVGSGKVGFSQRGDANSDFIGGMRGVVERNTMRYYLAIEAYLNALSAPPGEQTEKRLSGWFAATEQYPRQLHEMNRSDYLEMKRAETLRSQTPQ